MEASRYFLSGRSHPSLSKEGSLHALSRSATAPDKEGWPRHQVNGAKPPRLERTGWFVQLQMIGGFNEPLFMLRAIALALRARLRPTWKLRDIFLLGAATPPYPRRGEFARPKPFGNGPGQGGVDAHQERCREATFF